MKDTGEVHEQLPGHAPVRESVAAVASGVFMTTACHENEVPPFVEAEIERLYGSLFSTLAHVRHGGKLTATTSTYVTRRNGVVETVLLFERRGRHVSVLNELIHLTQRQIGEFVNFIFARYQWVTTIGFNAITAELAALPYPLQRFVCAEDIVVSSLTTVPAYTASLSLNTRKSIRRNTNGVLREHPSFQFSVLAPEQVSEELVRRIVGFNKARMAAKERVSAFNDKETAWIVAMTAAHGRVSVITIDGQVCAGVVACKVGTHYYMLVGAHDPAYDQFGLGMLCCYRSICSSIEVGATAWHLLWGRQRYKTSLCGVPRQFDRITVYRDRAAYLRNLKQATFAALTGYAREMRLWLVDAEHQDTLTGRLSAHCWRIGRRAKRSLTAVTSLLRPRS